ncbi:MAG: hypothetical protein JNM27_00200 [Leptospirales bacterium]|nr:hypothetical protein [Leptospirales bacterium]
MLSLLVLPLVTSCFTFNWGNIGYMEPGGAGNGNATNLRTTKHCELLNNPIFQNTLAQANSENGNPKMWKDVDTEVPFFAIPPCVIITGTPVN